MGLEISELRKQDKNAPLYVLNATRESKTDRANIVLSVPYNQNNEMVPVPVTWIPVELTAIVPREALLASTSFLKALRLGKLTAITEEEAKKILDRVGAKEEVRRINSMNINMVNEDDTAKIEGMQEEEKMSSSVVSYIELMENGTGIEALNSLRNLGTLEIEEYVAIQKKARSLGDGYKEVVRYCVERIQKLKEIVQV